MNVNAPSCHRYRFGCPACASSPCVFFCCSPIRRRRRNTRSEPSLEMPLKPCTSAGSTPPSEMSVSVPGCARFGVHVVLVEIGLPRLRRFESFGQLAFIGEEDLRPIGRRPLEMTAAAFPRRTLLLQIDLHRTSLFRFRAFPPGLACSRPAFSRRNNPPPTYDLRSVRPALQDRTLSPPA